MDITMPKLDGIDAVSEILKINPAAKIVMVTAAGQKTNIVEALKRGALILSKSRLRAVQSYLYSKRLWENNKAV